MRKLLLLTVACLAITAGLEARTWTSADGSRTFEGTLRSYNADSGEVTVIVNGRPMTFAQNMLSEEDITFLKEEEAKANAVSPAEAAAETEVGKKVIKSKLHRFDGSRYARAELDKTPEYYLFYYSASW